MPTFEPASRLLGIGAHQHPGSEVPRLAAVPDRASERGLTRPWHIRSCLRIEDVVDGRWRRTDAESWAVRTERMAERDRQISSPVAEAKSTNVWAEKFP